MKKQCYNKRNQEYLNGHRHSFVGFFTAGYPDTERFFSVIRKAQECGMGIFEIGFPAKDPYADGELIRKSHKMIDHRISNERKFWEKLRETTDHPIWLMGYKEDLIDTGIYLELAKAQVVDALVIPILPVGERIRLMNELKEYGVDMLGFIGNLSAALFRAHRVCKQYRFLQASVSFREKIVQRVCVCRFWDRN